VIESKYKAEEPLASFGLLHAMRWSTRNKEVHKKIFSMDPFIPLKVIWKYTGEYYYGLEGDGVSPDSKSLVQVISAFARDRSVSGSTMLPGSKLLC